MNLAEVAGALRNFYNNVEVEGNTVVVVEEKPITREEVHAALQYRVDMQSIRQVNSWTVVVIVD